MRASWGTLHRLLGSGKLPTTCAQALQEDAAFFSLLWGITTDLPYNELAAAPDIRILLISMEYSYTESPSLKDALERAEMRTYEDNVELSGWWGIKLTLAHCRALTEFQHAEDALKLLKKLNKNTNLKERALVEADLFRLMGDNSILLDDPNVLDYMARAKDVYICFGNLKMASIVLVDLAEAKLESGHDAKGTIEEIDKISSKIRSTVLRGMASLLRGRQQIMQEKYSAADYNLRRARRLFRKVLGRASREYIDSCIYQLLISLKRNNRSKARKQLLSIVSDLPVKQFPESYRLLKEIVYDYDWLKEDSETAPLFQSPVKRTIFKSVLEAAIREARKSHPNEFGALLKGVNDITELVPVPNTARGRSTVIFQLYYNPYGGDRVEGDGVIHSHPSGSAHPSKADLFMFSKFPGINIIIGYPYTMDSWAAYDNRGNRIDVEVIEN